MTSAEVREQIVAALLLDLVGPIADPTRESERLEQSPSRWYLTGFLIPSDRPTTDLHDRPAEEEEEEEEYEDENLFGGDDDPVEEVTAEAIHGDDSDKGAANVISKRPLLPSSFGLSLLVPRDAASLKVTVRWGDYTPEYDPEEAAGTVEASAVARSIGVPTQPLFALAAESLPGGKPKVRAKPKRPTAWHRHQRTETCRLDLRGDFLRPRWLPILNANGLQLEYLCRPAPRAALDAQLVPDGAMTVNVYLVNRRDSVHGQLKDQGGGVPG